jgi:creatinine amidohydrolase
LISAAVLNSAYRNARDAKLPPNIRIYWRFNELTQTGATGAPRKATRAKGDKILEVLEELLLEFIKDMEKDNWKYGLALGAY